MKKIKISKLDKKIQKLFTRKFADKLEEIYKIYTSYHVHDDYEIESFLNELHDIAEFEYPDLEPMYRHRQIKYPKDSTANLYDAFKALCPEGDPQELFISLHTSEPKDDQSDSEAIYSGYERIKITQSDLRYDNHGFENMNDIIFPSCTGGTEILSHIGVGLQGAGDGMLLFYSNVQFTDMWFKDAPKESTLKVTVCSQPIIKAGILRLNFLDI